MPSAGSGAIEGGLADDRAGSDVLPELLGRRGAASQAAASVSFREPADVGQIDGTGHGGGNPAASGCRGVVCVGRRKDGGPAGR